MFHQLNIRFIFSLIGIGAVVLVGLGVWTFAQSYLRTTVLSETQRVAGAVTSNGFRLALVTNELFLHGEIRSEHQWRVLNDKLRDLLVEHREILQPYNIQTENIGNSLDNLEKLYLSAKSTIAAVRQQRHELLDNDTYTLQVTQMVIRVAELQSAVDELESVVRSSVEHALGSSGQGVLYNLAVLFSMIILFGVVIWWLFYTRLHIPLSELVLGIKTISKINASFRPRKYAEDELGAVVDSLNALLDQLQEAERLQLANEANIRELAADLEDKNRQFAIISRFQAQFIHEPNHLVMFDKLLHDIIAFTDSEFGFIGDILVDDDGSDYLKCYAFSNIAWNDESRQFYEENKEKGFVFKKLDNLFGKVITDRSAIISNNPAVDPRSSGLPQGHPPLTAFLGVPIWYGERLVGEIGLANRKEGYNQALLSQLQPIVEACGRIIVARWEREAREKTEKELKLARKYLQNIFDLTPSGLLVVKPDGTLKQWNKAAELLTCTVEDLFKNQAMDDFLFLPAEQMDKLKSAIKKPQPQSFKQIAQWINDEQHYWDIVSFPLGDESGDVVIRFDDVSKRVRMQLMMVQSEKMLSLGGLAAGMAHELNNPLGGILQGLQNVQRRLSPEIEKNVELAQELGFDLEKVQTYLKERGIARFIDGIADSGMRATKIVKTMLFFVNSPLNNLQPEDIHSLIDKAIEFSSMDHDHTKKTLFSDIDIVREYNQTLPEVPCIGSEIIQVLMNLLRNAAQASYRQKGVSRIILHTYRKNDSLCIDVEDNAAGMDEQICKRVFEPFFTTKDPGEGTGLGLSVSYVIIHDKHHGDLRVVSNPGKGSKFTISLPLSNSNLLAANE